MGINLPAVVVSSGTLPNPLSLSLSLSRSLSSLFSYRTFVWLKTKAEQQALIPLQKRSRGGEERPNAQYTKATLPIPIISRARNSIRAFTLARPGVASQPIKGWNSLVAFVLAGSNSVEEYRLQARKCFPFKVCYRKKWTRSYCLKKKVNKFLLIYFAILHGENFMAIFITLSVVIWSSTDTLRIFATLVCFYYVCGNIRHTEYGNNYHTIDFHTVS